MSHITARCLKSRKYQKVVNYKNQWKRRYWKDRNWDEYEDLSLNSSSEKSDSNKSSLDQPSSDVEEEEVIEDSKRREDIRESLGDDKGGCNWKLRSVF